MTKITHINDLINSISSEIVIKQIGSSLNKIYLSQFCIDCSTTDFFHNPLKIEINSSGIDKTIHISKLKCSMELIERFVACSPSTIHQYVYNKHVSNSSNVLSWKLFAPYSEEQISKFEEIVSNDLYYCVGSGLISHNNYAIPASKVISKWQFYFDKNLVYGECDSSGLAAGFKSEIDKCIQRALLEVLERDAIMLAWRLSTWAICELTNKYVDINFLSFLKELNLNIEIFEVGDPLLVPVYLVLLYDTEFRLTCGSSCGLDEMKGVNKALLEAIMLRYSVNDFSSYKIIPNMVTTSFEHVLFCFQNGKTILSWFKSLPQRMKIRGNCLKIEELAKICEKRFFNHEPVIVNLSPTDSNYCVIRIVQPFAFRKEWQHSMAYMGGDRFISLKKDSIINILPHPYG